MAKNATLGAEGVYKVLAELPSFKRAATFHTSEGVQSVSVELEVRDHVRMQKQKLVQDVYLGDPVVQSTPAELPSDVVFHHVGGSGRRVLTFHKGDKRFIQVRDRRSGRLQHVIEVTERHKDFVINEAFGNPVWSDDGNLVAYVAEVDISQSNNGKARDDLIAKHRWTPSFGEQLTTVRAPAIFICDLNPVGGKEGPVVRRLTPAEHDSKTVFGQPRFVPTFALDEDEVRLVCTGYSSTYDGRRVGLVYCTNRPSSIYGLQTTRTALFSTDSPLEPTRLVEDETLACRSPRCYDDQVVFLSNPVGGPHASSSTLHRFRVGETVKWRAVSHIDTLVPSVDVPAVPNGFPGLYLSQLPSSCFVRVDGRIYVVLDSVWQSWKVPLIIDTTSDNHSLLGKRDGYSYTVLVTNARDLVVATRSSTVHPPELVVARLPRDSVGHFEDVEWHVVKKFGDSLSLPIDISKCESKIIKTDRSEDGDPPTEVVLTLPSSHNRRPVMVMWPHGGPHSALPNEFSAFTLAMALIGYSTAYVNYVGSIGFGDKWIRYLTEHLGEAEVTSTYKASRALHDLYPDSQMFVQGGSHGGFITAHLTARWPDYFAAAVLRNPVTDLCFMAAGGSDIPDWCFAETGLSYPLVGSSAPPASVDPRQYEVLRKSSPIASVSQVRTPSLLLLGKDDLRVSHQQGLAWAHALRGNGTETQVLLFDGESHPLDGIEASLTAFLATHALFKRMADRRR